LFNLLKEKKSIGSLHCFHPGFERSLKFYQLRLKSINQEIIIDRSINAKEGDKFLFSSLDDTAATRLKQKFQYVIEDSTEFIQLLRVGKQKTF
jgi:hypothetical protein